MSYFASIPLRSQYTKNTNVEAPSRKQSRGLGIPQQSFTLNFELPLAGAPPISSGMAWKAAAPNTSLWSKLSTKDLTGSGFDDTALFTKHDQVFFSPIIIFKTVHY
jgi:hypothetical protein